MRPRISRAVVLFAIAAVTVGAQPNPRDDKAAQRLAQFKKLRLIETLDLDEKTAEKFFVRYNEGQNKIDQARKDLREAIRQLEDAARAKVSDSELNAKSDQAVKRMQDFAAAVVERLNAVRPLLSPEQYAKLVVFEVRFTEALQRALIEGRTPRPGDGPPRPGDRDRRRRPPLEDPD